VKRVVIALLAAAMSGVSAQSGQNPPVGTSAPTARISGQIIDAASGQPIEHALLRLVSFEVMRVARSAGTDAEGRFTFGDLVPGRYQLTASARGYLALQFGQRVVSEPGRPIDLAERQHFARANFALARPGSIEGVLRDEFGDPAPGIAVRVSHPAFVAGIRRLMPLSGAAPGATTDDRGRFRIENLQPGSYYVIALAGVFADPDATGGFAPTFYPGTPQAGSAARVPVGPGQEVTGVDFPLVPVPTVSVSGRFVDGQGQPVPRADYAFMAHDSTGASGVALVRGVADADGRFALLSVPSGRYTIQAFGRPEGGGNLGKAPFGWLTIAVGDRELTDLEVRILPGTKARGRIVREGDLSVPLTPREVRVLPQPVEFESSPIAGGPPNSEVFDDWTFEVGNMSGIRRVRASIASPAWTVRRITWRGQDVTDRPLDFRTGDVDDLEIVITTDVSVLTGTVKDRNGELVDDCSIAIFAVDPRRWPYPTRYVTFARPNQAGAFRVTGLPAESYVVVALHSVESGQHEDPEFLERIRPLGTIVTIVDGQTQSIDLRLSGLALGAGRSSLPCALCPLPLALCPLP
jgi:hypothetical protein